MKVKSLKEIGGYFELEDLIHHPYYDDVLRLNSARNALIYLIKAKKIEKIYIPYFLCDSVSKALIKNEVQFSYYKIDKHFRPKVDFQLDSCEYLYLVNYYGQLSNEEILKYKKMYKNVIVDNVQAFFQRPVKNVDTIYSCRKFFGVPDGAYLSTTEKGNFLELEEDKSSDRMGHILGRYDGQASVYYDCFKKNDKEFQNRDVKKMSKISKNILGAIYYERTIKKRNENYVILANYLKKYNKLSLRTPEGPYVYPFYLKDGLEIKKVLSRQKIYIPTLWPNVVESFPEESLEFQFSANILPLPCDQRYEKDDMKFVVQELMRCIN